MLFVTQFIKSCSFLWFGYLALGWTAISKRFKSTAEPQTTEAFKMIFPSIFALREMHLSASRGSVLHSLLGSRIQIIRDRLRWIVWKRCSGSLWGHPWEVSLCGSWRFLRERGTIGGTSCCGSRCDSVEELFTGAWPLCSGRTPAYVSSHTVYRSAALQSCRPVCVWQLTGKGQPSSQGLRCCKVCIWHSEYNEVYLQCLLDGYDGNVFKKVQIWHQQHFRPETLASGCNELLWTQVRFVLCSLRKKNVMP